MRAPDMLGALRERRFRLLWLGQSTSALGDALVPVALAFAVLGLPGGSASDLGLVFAAQVLPLVTFILVGGVWADRLPRQIVMLTSDAVRGAVHATIAALLLTGAAQLWHLIALIAVYGAAEAFFRPAQSGLTPSTVSPERLQQANALLGFSASSANVLGPAVAGVIVAFGSAGLAFAIDAGTFAVSAVSLSLLRVAPAARAASESFLHELRLGWRDFTSRTWLWVEVAWATVFIFLALAPYLVLGPVVAKQSLGGAGAWAAILTGFGVGELAGGVLALRWKPERPLLAISALTLLTAPTFALLALRAPVALIVAAQLGAGLSMGFYGAVWTTTMQQHVPPDRISRVSAYDWLGSLAFLPLGFALAGPVSGAIGVSTTLWIGAGVTVVSTFAVLAVRDVRELRRADEAPAPAATMAADA
jgi:MFS family permease